MTDQRKATIREVVRIKNGWTTVSSRECEGSYRYASKRLAAAHIAELERADVSRAAAIIEHQANRVRFAIDYLALRASRPQAAVQLGFGF